MGSFLMENYFKTEDVWWEVKLTLCMLLRVEITGEPKYETELSFCQVKKQQKLKKNHAKELN